MKEKTAPDTNNFVEMTAHHQGWRVYRDPHFVRPLVEGLTKNYNRYGYYQCPCRDSWNGDRVKDGDIICPCIYCAADLEEYGQCLCGLFVSWSFAESGKTVGRIPERRNEERYP